MRLITPDDAERYLRSNEGSHVHEKANGGVTS